jgi:alkylation response protein AidB-like acyl-CoA dehydrogenase
VQHREGVGEEMLDMVVDQVVQIFAGYGYVEEYPAERAYRDARVSTGSLRGRTRSTG